MSSFSVFIGFALALSILTHQVPANAARILGYFPTPSKSHLLIHCAIANTLAEAGHDVTVISSHPNVYKSSKYKYIEIDGKGFVTFAKEMINKPQHVIIAFLNFIQKANQLGSDYLQHPIVEKFLRENGPKSFDLVIVGFFMTHIQLGLSAHFQCPLILSFMIQPILSVNELVANPAEISYTPSVFSGLQQPLSFMTRVQNFLGFCMEKFILDNLVEYYTQKNYNYHFPSDRYPPLSEVKKNISLVFTNHHFSQGPIRPNVPAVIEIGGIQIKEKPDPLPINIAKVLDDAKQGAIYFSLGSNVQGDVLPKEKAKIMFNVLSKLPYVVLWKWGDSEVPGTSANINYKSWLPQDDILTHKNVKLFITHGGQGSIVESEYHGVPMVGIPLFGDQHSNMANVVQSGFGLSLDLLSLTEERFRETIVNVLDNPKFADAVKTFSKLYRDRPMTPRQLVVYWVEYVLRHNGAKHMQSPAVHMNMFQLLSLDVIGFLLAIVVCISAILVKICKLLCCRGRRCAKAPVSKAKKNK